MIKTCFFCLFSFITCYLLGQQECALGNVKNSNSILYSEMEMEKIIDFKKYNAIFYGESHVRDFEPEFKFNFIRHLNKKLGVKDVFMEIGYSAAYFYNQYLATGDTVYLNYNKSIYSIGMYKTFWKDLYEFNRQNPDSLKLKIHGIDFERTEVLILLNKLKISDIAISENLQETFKNINLLNSNNSLFTFGEKFQNEFEKIKLKFKKNEVEVKRIYGENFKLIHAILNNNTPITSKVKPRNKMWIVNMEKIIIENKIRKMVCFFGASHTNYNNATSITNTIKGITTFSDSVLNIKGIYKNFFSYGQMTDKPKIFEYGYKEKELFNKYANPFCRGTLIATKNCEEKSIKNNADYLLFATDIVEEK